MKDEQKDQGSTENGSKKPYVSFASRFQPKSEYETNVNNSRYSTEKKQKYTDTGYTAYDTPADSETRTLNHTPTLSKDMNLFSHDHEHDSYEDVRKSKRNAYFGYGVGILGLMLFTGFGFFSPDPHTGQELRASVVTESQQEALKKCLANVQQKSSTEAERVREEALCFDLMQDKR